MKSVKNFVGLKNQISRTSVTDLPLDLIFEILDFCDDYTTFRFSICCKIIYGTLDGETKPVVRYWERRMRNFHPRSDRILTRFKKHPQFDQKTRGFSPRMKYGRFLYHFAYSTKNQRIKNIDVYPQENEDRYFFLNDNDDLCEFSYLREKRDEQNSNGYRNPYSPPYSTLLVIHTCKKDIKVSEKATLLLRCRPRKHYPYETEIVFYFNSGSLYIIFFAHKYIHNSRSNLIKGFINIQDWKCERMGGRKRFYQYICDLTRENHQDQNDQISRSSERMMIRKALTHLFKITNNLLGTIYCREQDNGEVLHFFRIIDVERFFRKGELECSVEFSIPYSLHHDCDDSFEAHTIVTKIDQENISLLISFKTYPIFHIRLKRYPIQSDKILEIMEIQRIDTERTSYLTQRLSKFRKRFPPIDWRERDTRITSESESDISIMFPKRNTRTSDIPVQGNYNQFVLFDFEKNECVRDLFCLGLDEEKYTRKRSFNICGIGGVQELLELPNGEIVFHQIGFLHDNLARARFEKLKMTTFGSSKNADFEIDIFGTFDFDWRTKFLFLKDGRILVVQEKRTEYKHLYNKMCHSEIDYDDWGRWEKGKPKPELKIFFFDWRIDWSDSTKGIVKFLKSKHLKRKQ